MSKKVKKIKATAQKKSKESKKKPKSNFIFSPKSFFGSDSVKKEYPFPPKQKIIEVKPIEVKHPHDSHPAEHKLNDDNSHKPKKSFWSSIFGSKKTDDKEPQVKIEPVKKSADIKKDKKAEAKVIKKTSVNNEKTQVNKKKEKKNLLEVFTKIFEVLNIFKKKKENEIHLLPEKSTITTIYDSIYEELKQKKVVKVSYLQKKFDMSREKIIELAMNFEETGKIEIIYPLIGSPRLALIEKGELADEID